MDLDGGGQSMYGAIHDLAKEKVPQTRENYLVYSSTSFLLSSLSACSTGFTRLTADCPAVRQVSVVAHGIGRLTFWRRRIACCILSSP